MANVTVRVSDPGAPAGWPLARVAGLPAIERNLMALRSVGVERVRVACGGTEHGLLVAHFAGRVPDRRLPQVIVERLADNGRAGDGRAGESSARHSSAGLRARVVEIDGRFVHHPERLRAMVEGRLKPASTTGVDDPRGVRLQPDAGYCEDITTAAGRARAHRAILHSLRKPTDGWFARTIDRSVSLAISSALAPFPVHPNVVTVGTLLVGVVSGLLAARGTYGAWVSAAALFLLASVLDGVDGELARMKFLGSATGQWLDTVCDDLTNAIYLSGLTAGAWHAYGSRWLLTTGVAAVTLDVVTVSFLYWQLITTVNARTLLAFEETILAPALAQPGLAGFVARLQPFVKRDLYAPLFLLFALANAAWLALPAAAAALAITLVFILRDFALSRGIARSTRVAAP